MTNEAFLCKKVCSFFFWPSAVARARTRPGLERDVPRPNSARLGLKETPLPESSLFDLPFCVRGGRRCSEAPGQGLWKSGAGRSSSRSHSPEPGARASCSRSRSGELPAPLLSASAAFAAGRPPLHLHLPAVLSLYLSISPDCPLII